MFGSEPKPRPIMEYVRELESKVYTLRNRERMFNGGSFAMGFAAGAAAVWFVRLFV